LTKRTRKHRQHLHRPAMHGGAVNLHHPVRP
jgi:hypothetical protein